MGFKMITKYIIYHKNKKINVLSTYWNLKNNGFNNVLEIFFKKVSCCSCPLHLLENTNKFRDYLNKEVLK